ncbi:MAG: glycine dehydrogenase, partial [Anaerolineaceae bacterium]|nr:glycine dehydrogenase [Anaerolineaceae bacterium]
NICTNQGLIALTSTVYMSLLGKKGMRQVAELCYQKAHYAANCINQIPGFSVSMDAPFFHEFVVSCPEGARVDNINAHLLEEGILCGYNLEKDYPELKNRMLIAVTEMNSRDEIDHLCEVLSEVSYA